MPRFEDLMDGQGRIRLRTPVSPVALARTHGNSVCRGWRLWRFDGTPSGWCGGQAESWLVELTFIPVPEGVDERGRMFVLDYKLDVEYKFWDPQWVTHQRYTEADFDALLAALEPYELVTEPDVCPKCQSTAWRHFEETPNILAFRVCYFCGHKEPAADEPLTVPKPV